MPSDDLSEATTSPGTPYISSKSSIAREKHGTDAP